MSGPPVATSGLGRAIKAAAIDLRDVLAGPAGIPASIDANQVPVPGAWVQFVSAEAATMRGYSLRFHVFLVVPQAETFQAIDQLGGLLTAALEVIEPEEPSTAVAVSLPHTPGQALPAMRLVVDVLADPNDYEE